MDIADHILKVGSNTFKNLRLMYRDTQLILEKVFKKKHSCGFTFQNYAIHPYA